MKLLIFAPSIFALISCTSTQNTSDTGDSHETGTPATYKFSEALITHISATLPFFAWREAYLVGNPNKPDPCPSIAPSADDKGFIVTGDCTDSRGIVFSGRFVISSAETDGRINYDFEAFSMLSDFRLLEMDGQMQLAMESDTLTNNVTLYMEDISHNISLLATYTDHTFGPLLDAAEALSNRPGKFASLGTVEIEEVDRFVLDGRFENAGQCAKESDNTVLVFTGERSTLTFTESAETCDGCTEWTAGSTSGRICAPWLSLWPI